MATLSRHLQMGFLDFRSRDRVPHAVPCPEHHPGRRADTARQRAWATSLAAWRRREGLAPDARVFVLTGPFPDARAALAARGWAENGDAGSACFDLKWSLRAREAWVMHWVAPGWGVGGVPAQRARSLSFPAPKLTCAVAATMHLLRGMHLAPSTQCNIAPLCRCRCQ